MAGCAEETWLLFLIDKQSKSWDRCNKNGQNFKVLGFEDTIQIEKNKSKNM